MPHSWLKIPANTSHKLRRCTGEDKSKGRFKQCLKQVVEGDGGTILNDRVDFDQTGKYAYVIVGWDKPEMKLAIVFDTEPVEVIDLADEADLEKLLNRDP